MSPIIHYKYKTSDQAVDFLNSISENDTNYYNILLNLFNIDNRFNDYLLSNKSIHNSLSDREYLKYWWYNTFIKDY